MTSATLESPLPPSRQVGSPRVLFLMNGFPPYGGAETAVGCLTRGLVDRGVDVHLADLLGPGPLPERAGLPRDRVATFDLGARRYGNLPEIARLYRYMRRMDFDVVHTHLELANTIGVPVARMARVPVVLPTAHSMRPRRTRRRLWVNRRLASMATRWIAVSDAIATHLASEEGMPAERFVTLPNAIDPDGLPDPDRVDRRLLRDELGLPPHGPLLAHIGSLRPEKRQKDLIAAFVAVVRRHPSAHLVIAGTGPLRTELGVAAERLGVGSRVEFLGYREDAARILAAADVSVLSSVREGLPVVILESFAVGTPVVATRVGGVPELLQDGRTGVLVRPRHVDELARALVDLLGNGARRERLAITARRFALERFSLDAVSARFLDLCGSLLDEVGRGRRR